MRDVYVVGVHTIKFGKFLDRPAYVAQVGTWFDLHDAVPHGVKGQGAQAFGGD